MARHLILCLAKHLQIRDNQSVGEDMAGLVFVWPLTVEVEVTVVVESV